MNSCLFSFIPSCIAAANATSVCLCIGNGEKDWYPTGKRGKINKTHRPLKYVHRVPKGKKNYKA